MTLFEGTNLNGDGRAYERVLVAAVEQLMTEHGVESVRIPLADLTAPAPPPNAVRFDRATDSDSIVLTIVPTELVGA